MRLNVRKSITCRLTLFFALASTLVLLALGLLIGHTVERHFEEQDLGVLTGKLELARHALEKLHASHDIDVLSQQLNDALVGHHDLAVMVIAPNGDTLFATANADFPAELLEPRSNADVTRPLIWQSATGTPWRGIAASIWRSGQGGTPTIVAIATDISHHQHFMTSFRTALWSVVVLAALLTGFLGWLAVRRGLAPLHALKHEAASITATRLNSRLSTDAIPSELEDLAATLNAMLARLEDSFRRLSDFSSDIAHELRTPVSNLLTQTQVTLSQTRTAEEYRNLLASNAEECERMSRMIADMLFLAKADNDLAVPHREALDLVAEVHGLFEFYEALAADKSIVMRCSGSGVVAGDKLMLRRAISNLLSNALRHTPVGGHIAVHVDDTQDGRVTLSMENSGETIPAAHLPRLFDRFYRADASRQRQTDGVGLGLAITRAILRAHGGDAVVRSADGVTLFELRLPA